MEDTARNAEPADRSDAGHDTTPRDAAWWFRRVLRMLFAGLLLASFLLNASTVRWNAQLKDGVTTYMLDLGRSRAWPRPAPPPYARFADAFPGLPPAPPASPDIRTVVARGQVGLELAAHLSAASLVCAIPYLLFWRGPPDRLMRVSVGVTAGMAVGIGLGMLAWLATGGWGPPFLAGLAVGGALVGGVLAPCMRTSPTS